LLRIGFYSLTGCEGCRHEVLNLGERLLRMLNELGIKITHEPLLGVGEGVTECDVAFVEGAVVSTDDLRVLEAVRRSCSVLVAMGACAVLGGVAAAGGRDEVLRPGRELRPLSKGSGGAPLSRFVSVDYVLRGCPVSGEEFLALLKALRLGEPVVQGERRFEFIKESSPVIEGSVIRLDGEKCIVCGRCVGVCDYLGLGVLGTVNRGVRVAVTTPFGRSFEECGCVSCGLCVKYCPVGALSYRDDLRAVQQILRRGGVRAYVEPEALASLAEALNVSPWSVVAGLREAGFTEVIVWGPELAGSFDDGLTILPASPAEESYVRIKYPSLTHMLAPPPPIPRDGVLITSCVARKVQGGSVLTAREAEALLSTAGVKHLRGLKPDGVSLPRRPEAAVAVGPYEVSGALESVVKGFFRGGSIAIYLCPGGCLMGGGQTFPKAELGVVEGVRARIYSEVLRVLGLSQ